MITNIILILKHIKVLNSLVIIYFLYTISHNFYGHFSIGETDTNFYLLDTISLSSLGIISKDWSKDDLNLKLNPYWVTGITDSEGCFSVSIQESSEGKYKFSYSYKVDQKEDSAGILYPLCFI